MKPTAPETTQETASTPEAVSSTTHSTPVSPWFSVQSAASYAAVSTDTIYKACELGELKHARIGGRRSIRIRAEWIDQWLERHVAASV
jgi:excisionase family DNA binding protein